MKDGLDPGFLSFPYVEAAGFDSFDCDIGRTTVAWLIPITSAERVYKKECATGDVRVLQEDEVACGGTG
jgi:hypothetical protein